MATYAQQGAVQEDIVEVIRSSARAGGLAVLAALAVYALAKTTGAALVITTVDGLTGPLHAGSVLGAAIATALCSGLFALLVHRLRHGGNIYLAVSIIVLAFSLSAPFAAAKSNSTALWLSLMHIAVAAAIVPMTLRALDGGGRPR